MMLGSAHLLLIVQSHFDIMLVYRFISAIQHKTLLEKNKIVELGMDESRRLYILTIRKLAFLLIELMSLNVESIITFRLQKNLPIEMSPKCKYRHEPLNLKTKLPYPPLRYQF